MSSTWMLASHPNPLVADYVHLTRIELVLRNWNSILSATCLPIPPQVQKIGLIGSAIRKVRLPYFLFYSCGWQNRTTLHSAYETDKFTRTLTRYISTPKRIRTFDPLLRRQMLYPAELWVHHLNHYFNEQQYKYTNNF